MRRLPGVVARPRVVRLLVDDGELEARAKRRRDYEARKRDPARWAKRQEYMRAWRRAHPEKVAGYKAKDREVNRVRIRVYGRTWARKNRKGPGVPRGERNGAARLTAERAAAMRAAYAAGKGWLPRTTIAGLARAFGVSQTAAWKVIRNETWRHVR